MHIIPRRKGDISNPIGGIRNVIVGKGNYKTVDIQFYNHFKIAAEEDFSSISCYIITTLINTPVVFNIERSQFFGYIVLFRDKVAHTLCHKKYIIVLDS